MNEQPIRAIACTRGISTQTVYEKIDCIHRQCLSFLAAHEAKLARKRLRGLYISVDRQDYIVNWSDRAFKRNTQLTAIGSAHFGEFARAVRLKPPTRFGESAHPGRVA
ncbi:hypothetical protein CKO28_22545 [Rhodovibrio sodomensis]|uniref:Uncharacterized protein n=1 Tax=Rhodovibrio sodomensis TaxID=1088 RepID=A0ABS1DJX3_9PROT|nr:hypothetical protein [Rhodovibrio sodomensis]MBK1670800.1 hypothetical protein [Rhodovibrio sodomensis]